MESRAQTLFAKVRSRGSVTISLATLGALAIHPTPWCVDCEFSNPSDRLDDILGAWSLAASFVAGLFAFNKGWLVPVCVVLATLIALPLGGVAWWSLLNNEGPAIVILGLPACAACLLLGYCIRATVLLARGSLQPKTQI